MPGFDVSVSSGDRAIVNVTGYQMLDCGITFLFGESGIGKSVISKALYGFNDNTDLNIKINGRPYGEHLKSPWTRSIRRNGFFVFQEPSSHLNPLMTIGEQLDEGSLSGIGHNAILDWLWDGATHSSVKKLLDVYPKPYRPSGGEKQRMLLAMAFKRIDAWIAHGNTNEPTLFVFDEPTGSLDDTYRNRFLHLLFRKYEEKPFTAIIITHDYSIISEVYDKYSGFMQRIRFKELSRTGDFDVALKDFSADDYLKWLRNAKRDSLLVDSSDRHTVLEVQPEFSIFNRNLAIYSDSNRTNSAPLRIDRKEMVYLKAPSGVGKTTLAKIIMGIYRPERFSMTLEGITVTEKSPSSLWPSKIWGKRAGMVFQHADEALNLAATVRESFRGLPLKKRLSDEGLLAFLSELFDSRLSVSFLQKRVAHLSGGQKQRLNLLRTLILGTGLVILDEPLNGLDFVSVKKVLALLDAQRSGGSALLMISHNEEIFGHIVDEAHIRYLGVC